MKPTRIVLACLVALTLAGVWLLVAPFGLSYQSLGAPWTTATINDMALGGALAFVGAASLLTYCALGARDLLARAKVTAPDGEAP